jgi:hypothetical protein
MTVYAAFSRVSRCSSVSFSGPDITDIVHSFGRWIGNDTVFYLERLIAPFADTENP